MALRLFVGGCGDAELKDTGDLKYVRLPCYEATQPLLTDDPLEFGVMRYEVYVLNPWRIGNDLFFIYSPEKQTAEETFRLLMNNYTPKSAEDLAI